MLKLCNFCFKHPLSLKEYFSYDKYMQMLIDYFLNNPLMWSGVIVFSICSFVFSLSALPLIVLKIPHDYFSHDHRTPMIFTGSHPMIYGMFLIAKNLLGLLFIFMGILMLVLPGQGILTIVVGLIMLNFPGKYQLERKLIQQPSIFKSLNWIRKKGKQRPLESP